MNWNNTSYSCYLIASMVFDVMHTNRYVLCIFYFASSGISKDTERFRVSSSVLVHPCYNLKHKIIHKRV